ncbi:hypothetical protein [Kocuria sp. U4B]
MTSIKPIPPADLRTGDRVQAWLGPALHHVGIVEVISRKLKVIWIRDVDLGERRMLDLNDYQLRHCGRSTRERSFR